MFQIIVDSAANIPAKLVKQYNINVISFVNLVNGKNVTCFDPELTPEEERSKGKEYYDAQRALKSTDPKALVDFMAEFCYNAEEAFSLEGDNKFNKVNIAE